MTKEGNKFLEIVRKKSENQDSYIGNQDQESLDSPNRKRLIF